MDAQARNYAQEIKRQESSPEALPALIGAPSTINAMRHVRMLRLVKPVISTHPDAAWLTIGDGGADGWMLRQLGAKKVTASSISHARLINLSRAGHLSGIEVRAVNAEQIDLPDGAVDFILCKEAFHHFPRAPLAFYEFMRVSRAGFMLIEPGEYGRRKPLDVLRTLAKLLLRRRAPIYEQFEPVGNYIYRVSPREIYKMLTAIQSSWFAIYRFNDFSTRWLNRQPRNRLAARALFVFGVQLQEVLSRCRLMNPGFCVVFVPTGPAADTSREALRNAGFRIIDLPKNPYRADDYMRSFLG